MVAQLGLEAEIFARLHTFGKALASNGGNLKYTSHCVISFFNYDVSSAAVLGSHILRNYLVNYARPLIYSTFMSFSSLASIKCAYDILENGETVPVKNHSLSIYTR